MAAYGPSSIDIYNSSFANARASYGGCIGMFGSVTAKIESSIFSDCFAYLGGAIYADTFSDLFVKESNFTNNFAY